MIKNDLAIFEDHKIRRTYDKKSDTWFFSVVDVVQVLTHQTDYQTARKYWNKLKERLRKEGSESVTNCHQLKLKASDGKKYLTDVANVETLLRLIQSIPSPKAEPFKLWLAKVGYKRIEDDNIPDFYKVYCERELVSLNTASMLWLDINPDEFNDQEEYYQYLVERKLYQKAIEITRKIQDAAIHTKELESIFTALAFSPKIEHVNNTNISFDTNGTPRVNSVNLLKFVLWTEKKNYQHPFPKKLASMIKEFHNVPDFKLENERLKNELSDVKAKNIKLEDELKIPSGKRSTSYQKVVLAALAKAYTKELLIQSFNTADNPISNKELDKSTNTKLTYYRLTQELNDAIGFNLHQETIKEVIVDSTKHIPKVKK